MGGGEYSEAELQYRRPLPMCSFSDLAGRYSILITQEKSGTTKQFSEGTRVRLGGRGVKSVE